MYKAKRTSESASGISLRVGYVRECTLKTERGAGHGVEEREIEKAVGKEREKKKIARRGEEAFFAK